MSNKKRTIGSVLTTSTQDVYVVPTGFRADVSSIFISNGSNNNIDVTLQWYSAAAATTYDIMDTVKLKPRSILQITNPFYLDRGDKITGSASIGSSAITVSIRTEENFANSI